MKITQKSNILMNAFAYDNPGVFPAGFDLVLIDN